VTTDRITSLPLSALHESPSNPRQTYNATSLQELADSIKSQGLLQPIVVRPRLPEDDYEIVFGHRRFRAAGLAGLEFIPAIVRAMTDEQVAVAQIHENLEREDVSPIEEAQGFSALMHLHGVTAQQLMADTGKSKSYIYGRLKLMELAPIVRQACGEDGLPADVAIKIARLPKAVQAKALDTVRSHDWVDGKHQPVGWLSQRQALRQLDHSRFFQDLGEASFDLHDASLLPRACSQCEHCSLTDPAGADASAVTCTLPECYEEKEEAHAQRKIEAHRAAGTLIEKAEGDSLYHQVCYGKVEPPYVSIGRPLADTTIEDHIRAMPEADRPTIKLMLFGTNGKVLVIDFADLAAVHAAAGLPAPDAPLSGATPRGNGAPGSDDDDTSHPGGLPLPLTEEEEAARNNWRQIRTAIMCRVASTARTTDDLRLVIGAMAEMSSEIPDDMREVMGWTDELDALNLGYYEDIKWLLAKLPEMSADTLGTLAVLFALDVAPVVADHRDSPAAMVKLAHAYGIAPLDPVAEPASTPSPAPRGEEKAKAAPKTQPGVKYRDPATGQTWSGRGLQPKWIKAALANGKALADFALQADLVGQEQKDDAGVAAGEEA